VFQIAWSMLAAFFGVQNKKNFERDNAYIEKKGIKLYIIMGFCLAIAFFLGLFAIVKFVVP
jgi:Protein of unknown function (DUF2970)